MDGLGQGVSDFMRALRFPDHDLREFGWFVVGALSFALIVWIAARLDRRRRQRPPPPPFGDVSSSARADLRVPVQIEARVLPEGGAKAIPGHISDLSAGGATIMIDASMAPGLRLHLDFQIGEEAFEGIEAEIVRTDPSQWSRRHYLHCRFLSLKEGQVHRLERALSERERHLKR